MKALFLPVVFSFLAGCASTAIDPAARQALAPTGKLRVAVYPGSPTSMIKDAKSGETRGVTWDLGRALAASLGVPFEPVEFARPAEIVEGLKAGKADVTFTNASPARAKDLDFSRALVSIEQGFLVPAGSKLANAGEVDRPGVRVGVTAGSTSEGLLKQQVKHVKLVGARNVQEAASLLSSGSIDAFATNKAILAELADRVPGSRILDGRFGVENQALGIPKGRDAGLPFLRRFAEQALADGTVQKAVERAGVRGTSKPD
jgi:polar amino acid transport system substrate-binding protein